MQIAIVGLGKMGANMASRLLEGGHQVFVFDRNPPKIAALTERGAVGLESMESAGRQMKPRRAVWSMLPAGDPTEQALDRLASDLEAGDILIDGGNSNYNDSIRRAQVYQQRSLSLVDAGVSGGIWGRAEGYSMMLGGPAEAIEFLQPALETLAPAGDRGWGRVGPSGAGHFVKMVHNGIEYGMMQAYAEGFEILRAKQAFNLDLHNVAEIWRYGSVVRSWLLDLTSAALQDDPSLSEISGWVADSGEGRWTVEEAIALDVPAPVISLALWMRFRSRQDQSYAARLLAAMRQQFGGHAVRQADG